MRRKKKGDETKKGIRKSRQSKTGDKKGKILFSESERRLCFTWTCPDKKVVLLMSKWKCHVKMI